MSRFRPDNVCSRCNLTQAGLDAHIYEDHVLNKLADETLHLIQNIRRSHMPVSPEMTDTLRRIGVLLNEFQGIPVEIETTTRQLLALEASLESRQSNDG